MKSTQGMTVVFVGTREPRIPLSLWVRNDLKT